MSEKNRKTRLAYAKKYDGIEPDDWNPVLWSNWTRVNLGGSDGIKYVKKAKRDEKRSEIHS